MGQSGWKAMKSIRSTEKNLTELALFLAESAYVSEDNKKSLRQREEHEDDQSDESKIGSTLGDEFPSPESVHLFSFGGSIGAEAGR
jgi:hypothetical protein